MEVMNHDVYGRWDSNGLVDGTIDIVVEPVCPRVCFEADNHRLFRAGLGKREGLSKEEV